MVCHCVHKFIVQSTTMVMNENICRVRSSQIVVQCTTKSVSDLQQRLYYKNDLYKRSWINDELSISKCMLYHRRNPTVGCPLPKTIMLPTVGFYINCVINDK